MKKKPSFIHPILVFIVAQLAWLSLVGLWIYWYVSNYIILKQVNERLFPQIISENINLLALIWGCILLLLVLGGMYLIFIFLARQVDITKLYDNFIANITHELKSPLASIQLYLETMQTRNLPLAKQKEFIELMLQDAGRLNNLINTILEISMLEQKRAAFDFQVYPAEPLIHSLINEACTQFKIPETDFRFTGHAPCQFLADRRSLRIVFNNLIDNAVKYSRESVQITVRIFCKQKRLFVELTDRGIGISPKDRKRLFTKFHRIYHQDIPNIKGTGLGLYIVKEILRYHGGRITALSGGEGKGSTFQLKLPVYRNSKRKSIGRPVKREKPSADG